MSATIQLRTDTSANWSAVNPILAAGEIGLDTTNKQFRVGNGTSAWNSLTAWTTGGGGGSSTLSGLTDVALGTLAGNDVLTYNSSTGKWNNKPTAVTFTFTATPLTTWTINHTFTYQPNVTIVDTSFNQIEAQVVYTSSTVITVSFSTATSGYAYLS
jgi:hypothetical protein